MLVKVISLFAVFGGGALSVLSWFGYQANLANLVDGINPSAVQVSQLADQATADIVAGISLMVFGLALIVSSVLSEIRDGINHLVADE